MSWIGRTLVTIIVIYLLLGALLIMWALGMSGVKRPPVPWWQVLWYIVTWPRVFWE